MYNKEITLKYSPSLLYYYFNDKEHPLAYKAGWVYYHRHVASLKLGRWLTKDDHVHHIDGNQLNNNPNNIEITSNSKHAKIHKPCIIEDIACQICGKIFHPRLVTAKFCSNECAHISLTKLNIQKEELELLVWEQTLPQLELLLEVSSSVIRKWCKRWGINRPSLGYWQKKRAGKI